MIGLGRFGGGVGVTRWLANEGAVVTVTDQADGESLRKSVEALADLDVTFHLGGHDGLDLSETELAVVNPAVSKATSELFRALNDRGIPWTTETNLFCERCAAPIVGVTGTYGKSTTCAMLTATLDECRGNGKAPWTAVHLGGNIGRSLLPELTSIHPTDLVVLEMSNAQLEDLPRIGWAPAIAVITNLSPHHLDRHGSFAGYISAKLNIARDPARASTVIVGDLHPDARSLLTRIVGDSPERIVPVTQPNPPVKLAVPGRHNRANAACVLSLCHHLGLDDTLTRKALGEFRGLPHRLEHVRSLDGVDYINDSKSTAPTATITAIEALRDLVLPGVDPQPAHGRLRGFASDGARRRIIVIVGGQQKNVSIVDCAERLATHCQAVICTGQSGSSYAAAVRAATGDRAEPVVVTAARLEDAVLCAQAEARPGDTVLFSPGAPSFDRYVNFTERGQRFVDLVNTL